MSEKNAENIEVPIQADVISDDDAAPDLPEEIVTAPKRNVGRPPGKKNHRYGADPPPPLPHDKVPTPLPPHGKYGNLEPRTRQPSELFAWVDEQKDFIKSRLMWYVYRDWPIISISERGRDGKIKQTKRIDKIMGEESFRGMDDVLRRYGSGDYRLFLNDQVQLRKPIAVITLRNIRDSDQPPVIDHKTLVVSDPANKAYIIFLQSRGIEVPGADPIGGTTTDEEENEMNVKVTERLMDTVDNLTEKNQELAERVANAAGQREERPPSASNIEAETVRNSIGIITHAAQTGMEMLKTMNTEMSRESSKTVNPITNFREILTLVTDVLPKPDNTVVEALLKSNAELQKEMRTRQETEMQALREEMRERRVVVAEDQKPKTMVEQMKEFLELKTVAQELGMLPKDKLPSDEDEAHGRRNRDDDEDNEEVKEKGVMKFLNGTLPSLITGAATLFGLGANMLHNLAVSRTGQGTPESPTAVMTAMQPQPQQAQIPTQIQATAMQSNVVSMPSGQPTTSHITSGAVDQSQVLAQVHGFLAQIQNALLAHFFGDQTTGATFASWMITEGTGAQPTQRGRQTYDFMREQGKESIVASIQTYPPIWDQVKAVPSKFDMFLDDFLDYDRIVTEGDDEDDDNDNTPTATGKKGTQ